MPRKNAIKPEDNPKSILNAEYMATETHGGMTYVLKHSGKLTEVTSFLSRVAKRVKYTTHANRRVVTIWQKITQLREPEN